MKKYGLNQKVCCNSFELHGNYIRKSIRPINIDTANQINELWKKDKKDHVKPGQKLCPTCRKFLAENAQQSSTDSEDCQPAELSKKAETEAVNVSFAAVGMSPLKLEKLSRRDSPGYAKRKLSQTQNVIAEKLATVSGLDPQKLGKQPSNSAPICSLPL